MNAGHSVEVVPDHAALAMRASDIVCEFLSRPTSGPLGTATGGTMEPVYAELVRRHKAGAVSFAGRSAFGLDEYVIDPGHSQSYHRFMQERLWDHVDVDPAGWHLPTPWKRKPRNIKLMCEAYEIHIADAEYIGLQLLGLGPLCHIGFNMPGSTATSRTRIVRLDEPTRAANSRYFGGNIDSVPKFAVTMGIATIMEARDILMLVSGAHKAQEVYDALEGDYRTRERPAVALRRHRRVKWIIDEAAASLLPR